MIEDLDSPIYLTLIKDIESTSCVGVYEIIRDNSTAPAVLFEIEESRLSDGLGLSDTLVHFRNLRRLIQELRNYDSDESRKLLNQAVIQESLCRSKFEEYSEVENFVKDIMLVEPEDTCIHCGESVLDTRSLSIGTVFLHSTCAGGFADKLEKLFTRNYTKYML